VKVTVIIPAGGYGKRFGRDLPKQFVKLCDVPIIVRTLLTFEKISRVANIIIAVPGEWYDYLENELDDLGYGVETRLVPGGIKRQDSVNNALKNKLVDNSDIILVHDAVRLFASNLLIDRIIDATIEHGAVIPVIELKDTVKHIDGNGFVIGTPVRENLRNVQTPQGFKKEILLEAYQKAYDMKLYGTDDSSLVEAAGHPVFTINGEEKNIKITTEADFRYAEYLMEKK
jgi:2-C-methyl-D-erythritol 4-phosphate cytidylyltransferase